MTAATPWVDATITALEPLADPSRAAGMRAYLKDAAPFLGIAAPQRRAAQREAWSGLPPLDEPGLVVTCDALWARPEREFQYAACDLVGRHSRGLSAGFIVPTQRLLTTKAWWDTVDSLGTVAVTPIVERNPALVDLMWRWLDSGDRWLVRAAVQHQRGRKERTDLPRLLAMCDRVAEEREFFVAKAVGWALRDVTGWDPDAVRRFVDEHPSLSAVARREAARGLARADHRPVRDH